MTSERILATASSEIWWKKTNGNYSQKNQVEPAAEKIQTNGKPQDSICHSHM